MSLNRRQFLKLGTGVSVGSGLGLAIAHHSSRSRAAEPAKHLTLAQARQFSGKTPDNPPRGALRIAVISDLSDAQGATDYREEVRQAIGLIPFWEPDLVLCSGDMVAGQDRSISRDRLREMWETFDRDVAEPLRAARLPYAFALGDNDASRARLGDELVYQQQRDIASAYWNMPVHDPGLTFVDRYKFPFYYTFRRRRAFFLVWDATSSSQMEPEDYAWIERSLGSTIAQSAAMRIVVGHFPLYAVSQGRDRVGDVIANAADYQALLERYHVHTYISGHHRAYFPGRLGNLEMLQAGALGIGSRPLLVGNLPPHKTLTLLDIDFLPARTTYTTFELPSLLQIDQAALPRSIPSQRGMVIRRDLTWDDLTPAEREACAERLPQNFCHT